MQISYRTFVPIIPERVGLDTCMSDTGGANNSRKVGQGRLTYSTEYVLGRSVDRHYCFAVCYCNGLSE
jgi:hypothetical protein